MVQLTPAIRMLCRTCLAVGELCVGCRDARTLEHWNRSHANRTLHCLSSRQFIRIRAMACRSAWLASRRGLCHAVTNAARRGTPAGTTAVCNQTAVLPAVDFGVRFASACASSSAGAAGAGAGDASGAENLGAPLLYAVPKVAVPTLAVVGSNKRFPVRRVYCVGSNYR